MAVVCRKHQSVLFVGFLKQDANGGVEVGQMY